MSENPSVYENTLLLVDVKSDGIIDGIDENRIKESARNYAKEQRNTLTDREFQELINRIETLLKRHDIELVELGEKLEQTKQEIQKGTQEKMSVFRRTQNIGGALWDGWEEGVNGAITGTAELFERTGTWIGETSAEAIHGEEGGLTNKLVQDTEGIRNGLDVTGKVLGETLGKLSNGEENEVINTTTTYWREQVRGILNMTPEECARLAGGGLAFAATAVIGAKGLDKVSKMNTISSEISIGNGGVTKIIDKVVLKGKEMHMKISQGNGNNELNLGDYRAFSGQRGAVGERRKPEIKRINRNLNALTEQEKPIPPAIGDIGKGNFDVSGFRPADGLHAIKGLNKHLDYKELIGNFRGIEEFTKTIEKISNYILNNRSKISPEIADDMFNEIRNLRKNVSNILKGGSFDPVDIQPLKTALEKDIDKALRSLKPQVFQTTK